MKAGMRRRENIRTFQPEMSGAARTSEEKERERDIYYTYPALRLIQVLPGHPLADPKDETVSSIQRRTSL